MSVPVLDELAHVYHIEGRPLASVTKVIKAVWPNRPTFENAPVDVLERARYRGERVDYWVGEYAKTNGNLDVEDLPDVVESVEFFEQWWKRHNPTYLDHQRIVWNESIGVCGKFDLLLLVEGEPVIIDTKRTYNEEQTWIIQLGAYRDLYHHMTIGDQFHVDKIGVLHIHPKFTKGYTFRRYDTAKAVEAWRSTVAFWQTVNAISK